MSILVSDILVRVGDVLNDEDHVRWPVPELIRWINDCGGAVLNRRPAALSSTVTHTLVAGPFQSIPTTGALLLDVVRNIKADDTPGRGISIADRKILDDAEPDWYQQKPATTVMNYTHDPRAPTKFYVYPPVQDGVKVELLMAGLPPAIVSRGAIEDVQDTDIFEIGPEYMESVVNFIGYRCMIKDSEFSNAAVATAFYSAFQDAMIGQVQGTQTSAPESASV